MLSRRSKRQYETKFRHWGMVKNLNERDWRAVIQHLNERRQRGRDSSTVLLHGRHLPEAKIRKAVQRYSYESLYDRFFKRCKWK